MPKVQVGTAKKRCHYCSVEVSSSNWSKHCSTQRHLSKESAAVRRATSDDDEDFVLASPTRFPQPSTSTAEGESEVLAILKEKNIPTGPRAKNTRPSDKPAATGDSVDEKTKRDKASLNFFITAHSKRKYVYARCMAHWSKCYIIGREFNNGGF